jgi:hypothetical protein
VSLPRSLACAVSLILVSIACTSVDEASTSPQTVAQASPSPSREGPRLKVVPPYGAFCDVSSVRANFWGRPALDTAYVWRTPTPAGDCPRWQGETHVAFGLDGPSAVQDLGTFECVLTCTAARAIDVNRDGYAELAVDDGRADGWATWLFTVRYGPSKQRMAPIVVAAPGDSLAPPELLTVSSSGSAGASAGARCATLGAGDPGLVMTSMVDGSTMRTVILQLRGVHAAVVRAWNKHVGPRHHPTSGLACRHRWRDASPEPPLCDVSGVVGDVNGDGISDRVSVGAELGGHMDCPYEGHSRLVVDLGDDGQLDVTGDPPVCSTGCGPFAIVDLNADGIGEVFMNEGHLAAPESAQIAVYELEGSDLVPIDFPSGSNRFSLQDSWQGYYGASCPDPWTFSTWSTPDQSAGPDWIRITSRSYRLEGSPLRFVPTAPPTVTRVQHLPDPGQLGFQGSFCGQRVNPI